MKGVIGMAKIHFLVCVRICCYKRINSFSFYFIEYETKIF